MIVMPGISMEMMYIETGRGGRRTAFLTDEEKKNKPVITSALIKRVLSYLLPYWKQMLLVFLAIVLSAVFGMMPAILTGKIIDDGLIGRNFNTLVILLAVSLAVLVLSNLTDVLVSYLNVWMSQRITYDMRNKMYAHLQNMSQRFFTSSRQGDIITRMTSDIDGVQTVISGTLTSILSNIAVLATALAAMYQKNWILATVGIIIVPLFTIPTKRVGKTRWELTLKSQECHDEANQILNETLSVSGQMLVKLFTSEKIEYDKYEKVNMAMVKLNIKESLAGRWFRVVMNIFTNIGPMLIYLAGGVLIFYYGNTSLTVGDITVMVALLSRMYAPVNSLMNIQVDVIRSMAMFTRIFSCFDMHVEIKNAPDAIVPTEVKGELEFENVAFFYDREQPILKKISFRLPAGKSTAIVGPSGAGKSTIINLISRLYDVTEGKITLDGRDLRKLDLTFLRKNIGVVSQDAYLFNGTIRENLLYANPGAADEDIINACRKANIHEFIMSLPLGYDTYVGNRGLKLSGGEKQRVSIARVILKNPPILIFDEATSSLDSISESLIQDAVDPLLEGRTSLVIAHRLSTILAADEILVVNDGQIAERGTHSELVGLGGLYTELYETQFRRAIQEYVNQ